MFMFFVNMLQKFKSDARPKSKINKTSLELFLEVTKFGLRFSARDSLT